MGAAVPRADQVVRASASLRRRWNRSLALLVASVVGAVSVGVTVAVTLTSAFESTAVEIERHTSALNQLRDEIAAVAVMSYTSEVGSPRVATARRALAARFDQVSALSPSPEARALVQRARRLWSSPPVPVAVGERSPSSPVAGAALVMRAQSIFGLLERAGAESRAATRQRFDEAGQTRNVLLTVLGLVGLVAVFTALRLARRLSHEVLGPLGELRASTDRLRDGALEHRASVGRGDEIGELAASFNAMADSVMQMKSELVARATSDPLTGLGNREAFEERLSAAAATEDPERPGAVLFIDLDDFKQVNDRLGHAGGDQLLRLVAMRIHHAVRPGDFVARLGGDEFAVVLDGEAGPEAVAGVGERLVAAFEQPMDVMGEKVLVGASVGLAYRRPAGDVYAVTNEADIAMYAAKRGGKNRLERFDPRLHDRVPGSERQPGGRGLGVEAASPLPS